MSFHHSISSSWLRARKVYAKVLPRPKPPVSGPVRPSMWNLCVEAAAVEGAPSVHSGRKSDSSG